MEYFNRHECMGEKTRRTILESIMKCSEIEGISSMGITNMLYGLFDGFDYSDAIHKSKEIFIIQEQNNDLYCKLLDIVREVKGYPKHDHDVTEH